MPARLKSQIWVQAFLRTNEGLGRFGAILHKGAAEAGAVYVVVNHQNQTLTLLGPPPGPAFDDEGTRLFRRESAQPISWHEISAKLDRIRKSDPDIWAVEVEDRGGLAGITPVAD